jgi:hypothetical protein
VAADREAAWTDLASADAARAYQAILALAADPGCGAFLRDRMKPAAPAPAAEVRKLVAALDDPVFEKRERATAGLKSFGEAADAELREALKGVLSAEQRRRVEAVLAPRGLTEDDPEGLRALRCVEVLERSGTVDAREVLGGLAKGAAGSRLTGEAAAALRRLPRGR